MCSVVLSGVLCFTVHCVVLYCHVFYWQVMLLFYYFTVMCFTDSFVVFYY